MGEPASTAASSKAPPSRAPRRKKQSRARSSERPAAAASKRSLWQALCWGAREIATADPRTLGFFRICVALVLIADLAKRALSIHDWYFERGLLPIGSQWSDAQLTGFYSVFWYLRSDAAVVAGFVAIFLVYLGLLSGYRTRIFQLLSLVGIVSLQARVPWLANGGDFVLCSLLWWTLFLPLGKRFSVDACRSPDAEPDRPVVAAAMVVALAQLALIYLFNALHKGGPTWRDGTAIHYVLWQERIMTGAGLWAREHLPLSASWLMTQFARWLEYMLPLLILSPLAKTFFRRIAVLCVFVLHLGISLFANFGMFSAAMCVFAMLLWTAPDWDWLIAAVDRRWPGRRERWAQRVRSKCQTKSAPAASKVDGSNRTVVPERVRRVGARVLPLLLVVPLAIAIPQMFVENAAIPRALRIQKPPEWFDRLVWATRLRQGWSMFAPDAPRREMSLVVDALTQDGRAVDPIYEAAIGDGTPHLDQVPVGAGMDVYWVDFLSHVPHKACLRQGLHDWLRDYHLRSGRAGDRLTRFEVFHVQRASPPPGEREPRDFKRVSLLRGTGAR